jgi:hypothetical protein
MTERNPIFELHIRPMFRLLDRQHMLRVGQRDLWDYNYVKRESAKILVKLKGPGEGGSRMPTQKTGGEWPSEWISLFDRWIQGGFRRLSLGKAKNLTLREDSDIGIFLQCSTDVPATTDHSSQAWFQSEFVPGAAMTAYQLYVLAGEHLSTDATTVEIACIEIIDGPIPQQGITVIDKVGTHLVNLPDRLLHS